MQKITTPLNKTDLLSKKQSNSLELHPKSTTIQRILQFASSYRVEKTTDNQFVELFLN